MTLSHLVQAAVHSDRMYVLGAALVLGAFLFYYGQTHRDAAARLVQNERSGKPPLA